MKNFKIILFLIFPVFLGACQEDKSAEGMPIPANFYYMYVNTENGGPYHFEDEEMVNNIYCYTPGHTYKGGEFYKIETECRSVTFIDGAYIFAAGLGTVDHRILFEHPNGEIDTINYYWTPKDEPINEWASRKVTHRFKGEIISQLDFANDEELRHQLLTPIKDPIESRIIIRIPYTH